MSKKIELTEKEIELIQKYLKGKLGMFTASEEEQAIFIPVIDKAEKLMHELKAYEESGDDLIKWYWNIYQNQDKK